MCSAGHHPFGAIRDGREADTTDRHRGRHAVGRALCAGPVPVRAAALDAGQVHLPAPEEPEERKRRQRQREREPQQFPSDDRHVRSILAAAALTATIFARGVVVLCVLAHVKICRQYERITYYQTILVQIVVT